MRRLSKHPNCVLRRTRADRPETSRCCRWRLRARTNGPPGHLSRTFLKKQHAVFAHLHPLGVTWGRGLLRSGAEFDGVSVFSVDKDGFEYSFWVSADYARGLQIRLESRVEPGGKL